jgi:HEAT repeat protein
METAKGQMVMRGFAQVGWFVLAFVFALALPGAAWGEEEPKPVVDLTKTVLADAKLDHQLGPTGLRGWMHTESYRQSPHCLTHTPTTGRARQILVTAVDAGSPADGKIAVGDVILGIGDEPFTSDPRWALADAINEAEKKQNKGELKLLRWRPDKPNAEGATERSEGKTQTVTLQLKVLGTFSDTAPFDCPKSAAILKQAVEALAREDYKGKVGLPRLALLATGEKEHIAKVKELLGNTKPATDRPTTKEVDKANAWHTGYDLIALAEYHLLTADKAVLPMIRHKALILAMGQSISGTWGHGMASPTANNGKLHGRLGGYAALNQPSLTCFMALVMAQRCGIDDREIATAVLRVNSYFAYYTDKGGIPYGYGDPREYLLTNNGSSGTAAITFAIMRNRDGAKFFSRLSAAAAHKLEVGHTGTYFNTLWTGLGANLSGPAVYAEFFKQWTPLRTLARKWDGSFAYQHPGGGPWGYRGLSPTAAMVLHYALPRRKLHITGKGQDESLWLTGDAALAAARLSQIDYGRKFDEQLLELLGHDLPLVRRRAADEIGKRDRDWVPRLLPLLDGNRHQVIGACHALATQKEEAAPAAPKLLAILRDPKAELWHRMWAVNTLEAIGEPARAHLPELMEMASADIPGDDRRHLEMWIGRAITRIAEKPYVETLDHDLLFPAVLRLMTHPHEGGRRQAIHLLADLPLEEFHRVADPMVHLIRNKDASFLTYHTEMARKNALAILERLNIQEGIDLAIETIPGGWGLYWRLKGKNGRLEIVKRYGANAKPYIPKLKALKMKQADEAIAFIKAATERRELITLEQAKAAGKKR